MAEIFPLYLAGEWCETGEKVEDRNPYDGSLLALVCQAGAEEVERATEVAVATVRTLRELPAYRRAEILLEVANQLRERKEDFAQLISRESGIPRFFSSIEVDRAIHTLTTAAEEAKRIGGEVIPLDLLRGSERRWAFTRRVPIGPVLGITPFNFPLNLVLHKVAPAVAAGNPIVIKPSPHTPCTALRLAELFDKAGLPKGALSVLPMPTQTAERLVRDDRYRLLSFTGSDTVGWYLKSLAGRKRVILEMGGNAGAIVHSDAPDLDYAAERVAAGAFGSAGQVCISVQRIFVHRPIYDHFREKLVRAVALLPVGDPLDPNTRVGPMIDAANLERVSRWVSRAVDRGARVVTGGEAKPPFYLPTLLENVDHSCEVYCEEVFGPVAILEPYDSFADAVALVNESRFGLQAGVFTSDFRNFLLAADQLEVGGVILNDVPTYRVDHMPYGGVKDSGFGREGLRWAIEQMTELKLVVISPMS
jgi:glyceraldehyde-3-phosphate dehydrogenase (NADP+)